MNHCSLLTELTSHGLGQIENSNKSTTYIYTVYDFTVQYRLYSHDYDNALYSYQSVWSSSHIPKIRGFGGMV